MTLPTTLAQTWDEQADVVVVGFGAAGFAASVTAHDLGAEVVILEKAPEGKEGGNTRVAGQGYLNTSSEEDAVTYLKALCGEYTVPDVMVRTWAKEMCLNNAWLTSLGADPQEHQHPPEGIEFPELPGSQCVHKFHDGPTYGYSNTWKCFENLVKTRPIRILYETPGLELIQNGHTGEILGVRATRGGATINVKARKAVILTCGGFENNQEMIRNYLPGLPYCYTSGSPYNEGDGVSMALSVGADLWHMNNYAGLSMALKVPQFPTTFSMQALHFSKQTPGGMVVVGADGRRFTDEKFKNRHGKIPTNGIWKPLPTPCPMFMVFDHTLLDSGPLYDKTPRYGWTQIIEAYDWSDSNLVELEAGWIKRAETVEELANVIGLDPTALGETVTRWNTDCASGLDTQFGRSLMLTPIAQGPFYAVPLSPSMLNTQGGPRRNEHAQIVRPTGEPIPRLYSAGELGSIYSNLYQGTGNIGECLVFGRISARNAVNETPWQ
ncbi:MAG: succinate dehydrogenase/fumarate reductase flavoprotein subunit [Gammaproteobacteria bacterium]|jgi:succinate dehydrogenase/fumarate reductase flavoprotein subunit